MEAFLAHHGLVAAAHWESHVASIRPAAMGAHIVDFQRRERGVRVVGHRLRALISKRGDAVGLSGKLPIGTAVASTHVFALTPEDALRVALEDFCGAGAERIELGLATRWSEHALVFELDATKAASLWRQPDRRVKVERVHDPTDNVLVPAYLIEVSGQSGTQEPGAFAYTIDATSGAIRQRRDLWRSVEYRVWADAHSGQPHPNPWGALALPHESGPLGGQLDLTPPQRIDVECMNQPCDPWLPPDATEAVGNNANVRYRNGPDPDEYKVLVPLQDGSFDYSVDFGAPLGGPAGLDATATAAFYTVNYLHDLFYDHGFTEAVGNPQQDNYGRGGLDGDPVQISIHPDYPNSGAFGGSDGTQPRMEIGIGGTGMWLWALPAGAEPHPFRAALAAGGEARRREAPIVLSVLSPECDSFVDTGLGGRVVAVSLRSKYCTTSQVATLGEQAGVQAVILGSLRPNRIDVLGGVQSTVPVAAISAADFESLEAMLGNGEVQARVVVPFVSHAVDATVVAHEWAHILFHRLGTTWVGASRPLDEGTADAVALIALSHPNDVDTGLDGVFPYGAFSTDERGYDTAGEYTGARRYPYSVDLTKSPLSLRHIATDEPLPRDVPRRGNGYSNSEAHNAGEVWAVALWEVYVALVDVHGYAHGRRRMLEYIVSALQLLPEASLTYLTARDAFLLVASDADRPLLWRAFAKRGMGVNAVAHPVKHLDFRPIVEDFAYPGSSRLHGLEVEESSLACAADGVVDKGEIGMLRVHGELRDGASSAILSVASDTEGVHFPDGTSRDLSHLSGGEAFDMRIPFTVRELETGDAVLFSARLRDDDGETAIHARVELNYARSPSYEETLSFTLPGWTHEDVGAAWHPRERWPGTFTWRVQAAGRTAAMLTTPAFLVADGVPSAFVYDYVHWKSACSVVEISKDHGATWIDVAELSTAAYNGVCDQEGSDLHGKMVHTGLNPDWPQPTTVRLELGTELGGETVQVRFRAAGNWRQRRNAWEIYRVAVEGATSPPFVAHVPNADTCVLVEALGPATVEAGHEARLDAVVHGSLGDYELEWRQVEGLEVALTAGGGNTVVFKAPSEAGASALVFEVSATATASGLGARDRLEVAIELATGGKSCSDPPAPDGTACDDSNACTQADSCQAGACMGTDPVVCVALDACYLPGTCDPATGLCSASVPAAEGSACDDGNACTQSDSCQAGACVGADPVACALDACHLPGTCDPATGLCSTSSPAADGTACDDGNACTQADSCQAGACMGTDPVACVALDACYLPGTCDPATGLCFAALPVADGTPCGDGRCRAGACIAADKTAGRKGFFAGCGTTATVPTLAPGALALLLARVRRRNAGRSKNRLPLS